MDLYQIPVKEAHNTVYNYHQYIFYLYLVIITIDAYSNGEYEYVR